MLRRIHRAQILWNFAYQYFNSTIASLWQKYIVFNVHKFTYKHV
jgi:hypothetical protein